MSLLKQRRHWLLQCALAYVTPNSMLLISFKIITFKIYEFVHPWGSPVPNTTCVSVVRELALPRMKTFLHLRKSFSSGIGSWALACIASKTWCVSSIMKNQMATRLFFLPSSSQNLIRLKIVLFFLVICDFWHVQGSVPQMFCRCNYLKIVKELSQGINTLLVISSLQTSSSVRCPDVCQLSMDKNHKTAVFKVGPS